MTTAMIVKTIESPISASVAGSKYAREDRPDDRPDDATEAGEVGFRTTKTWAKLTMGLHP